MPKSTSLPPKAAPVSDKKKMSSGPSRPSVARSRLEKLFDPGSFEEIGAEVLHRSQDFGLEAHRRPGDGVVTGVGLIEGRPVFAYSQDRTILGGSLGEAHALKIARLQDLAFRRRAPFVGINDSGGARIQEGVDSLAGYGEIFRRHVRASGIIPQISLIFGPCAGGAVYSPALTDFIGMVMHQGYMFLTGPRVVKTVTFEDVTTEDLGGGGIHAERSGVTHFLFEDEEEALAQTRRLLAYLPSSCYEAPPKFASPDPIDRLPASLATLVPSDPRLPYDIRHLLALILDRDSFFEIHALWAPNVVVGLARLGGEVVGCIANQPDHLAGVLDIDASRKAARFIRMCDAFGIPLLTFVDVPGFLPGTDQEHQGIITHGAKLLYAYCEATVPKLSVILRKAYGGAYIVMSSKSIGGDINLAWPQAEIAVMGAKGAVEILFAREIQAHPHPDEKRAHLEATYAHTYLSPQRAAERGLLDEIIDPCETRRKLFRYLQALSSPTPLPRPPHGNLPT